MIGAWTVGGCALVVLAVIWVMLLRDVWGSHDPTPVAQLVPVQAEPATGGWPTSLVHTAPLEPFTPDQAHQAMQLHIDCDTDACPRRQAALDTLIQAGHVRPARIHG
ncbi:hypothetical protein [Nocardia vaccinii]|uniref:hypothetical protein n=1 Tax=Nocardia vaccinii TaxID=1822 RepID=UPI0008369824|nr:hypothetical protein [Nocardia vaccinii]